MKENSIGEEIKIALDKFLDNKDKDSAILIVEKFILGNYILIRGGRTNIVKNSLRYILSDYKRVLKENEILKKEKEQAWEEWNNLEQGSYETEQKLKQQIKESQRENEELKERIREHTLLISPYYVKENYIPIQKIKDKIEELNREIGKSIDNSKGGLDEEFIEKAGKLLAQKRILQELLERRK